jgi:hypothetical protein
MQVRYVEDLASHDDLESCVGGREAIGEALTGEHPGAKSREKFSSGAPTLWREAEGNMGWRVMASATSAPRGQETSCASSRRRWSVQWMDRWLWLPLQLDPTLGAPQGR